jgi:hypothetical protein
MGEWMDGWMDDGWMGGEWEGGCVSGWMDGGWMGEWVDGLIMPPLSKQIGPQKRADPVYSNTLFC